MIKYLIILILLSSCTPKIIEVKSEPEIRFIEVKKEITEEEKQDLINIGIELERINQMFKKKKK